MFEDLFGFSLKGSVGFSVVVIGLKSVLCFSCFKLAGFTMS